MDERVELLRSIKSQRIVVPDLRSIFLDWPGIYNDSINQHYGALTEMVNKRLEGLYTNADMLRKLKDADFAYFTSLWWPQAPFEELQVLAFLVIWLFTWDDEIDEPTGAVADDFDAAQRYREETSNFVELCLGLAVQAHNSAPRNLIVRSFRDIADGLCAFYNLKQRRRFLEEISRFMEMSQREQEFKLSGTLPSLAEYWEFRLGTSAVYVGLAAME
ncbi:MAG: hypothetical protein M1820_005205 [Bogoriella megaspora]|nr:MAG: hypothetical protein M1820_005205 [Bogoriella megaspora]